MTFRNIIGQTKAKEIIIGQMRSARTPHAYLFLGPEGVGRKKTALELAKYLNCETRGASKVQEPCDHCLSSKKIDKLIHPDVQIIDFEHQAKLENKDLDKQKAIKIDTIRALQKEINLKPVESRWKIFIIEPAEKITTDAANCLLKTLEEPPAWTVLILLAKHKENLPPTVVSRTQIVPFGPIPQKDIAEHLVTKASLDHFKADEIAKLSEGSLSEAYLKISDSSTDARDLWLRISSKSIYSDELLAASQQNSKNAGELINGLLLCVKEEFRKKPQKYAAALEAIMYSQKLLEKNVNPQMLLDTLLFKLYSS